MVCTCKFVFFISAFFVVVSASPRGQGHPNELSQLLNEEVPYIVALWQVTQTPVVTEDNTTVIANHTTFKCAGVLVSSEYALTTISCLDQTKSGDGTVVSAGHLKRGDLSKIILHDVIEETPHELYNNVTLEHDLVIIKISPGFASEPHVSPLRIHKRQTPPGAMCTATGWRLSFYFTSDDLRTKTVFRLDDAACNDVIAGYEDAASRDVSDDVREGYASSRSSDDGSAGEGRAVERLNFGGQKICAADKYHEECNVGDEGGPLVCDGALAGIFSNYILVCLQSAPEPAFYHDVTQYADWIALNAPGVELYDSAGSVARYTSTIVALMLALLVAVLN